VVADKERGGGLARGATPGHGSPCRLAALGLPRCRLGRLCLPLSLSRSLPLPPCYREKKGEREAR
jgi:hypothetical protein